MTVLVKFQIEIRFSIELHGNSKLSMTSCPPSSGHNEEPEIRNRILWEGVRFLGVGGNQSARRKPTKAGMESAKQIHIQPLASCIGERKV